ncbi:MAG TPA: hypothetical protein VGR21_09050 [Cryptosporangiaceae bacterium]|nr:hypothetical protein [Cryptosporangiaceae bacterium]
MPAPTDPSAKRGGRRRFAWLFWIGVAIAPVAALLLVLGQGVGPPRAAAVLAVLAVVMIGLSVTFRDDAEVIRDDFREQLRLEVDLVRSDVDSLRRGVELTVHRELERVRGELEATRRETVLRAESTRLSRVTGELPAADRDSHTIEPIYEEYGSRTPRSSRRLAEPEIYRDEPVRVVAARIDSTVVTTTREPDFHHGGPGYERSSYEPSQYESVRDSSPELEDARTLSARLAEIAYVDPDPHDDSAPRDSRYDDSGKRDSRYDDTGPRDSRYDDSGPRDSGQRDSGQHEQPGRHGSGRHEPQGEVPARDSGLPGTGRRASRRRAEEREAGYDRGSAAAYEVGGASSAAYDGDGYDTSTSLNGPAGSGSRRAKEAAGSEQWSAPAWDSGVEAASRSTGGWNPPDWDRDSDRYDATSDRGRGPRVIAGDVVGTPDYSVGGKALSEPDFGRGAGFGTGTGFGSGTAFGSTGSGWSAGSDYGRPDIPALPEGSSTASSAAKAPSEHRESSWSASSWVADRAEPEATRSTESRQTSRHGARDNDRDRGTSRHGSLQHEASPNGAALDPGSRDKSGLNGSSFGYGASFAVGPSDDYGVDFEPPNLDHLPPAPSRSGGRHSSTDGYHDPYQ